MLTVSSTAALVDAVAGASDVSLTAYVVRPGAVVRALEGAGDRGARVRVRVEPKPFGDDGSLRAADDAAIAELRAHGVDAGYFDGPAPLHMKAAVVDGEVFLDDRNWPDDGRDFIVRTRDAGDVAAVASAARGAPQRDAHVATRKSQALAQEAHVIYATPSHAVDCESESFGFSTVYAALKTRASKGDSVRLLVSARDLQDGANTRELAALHKLAQAGVSIRVGADDEKICVAGDRAWVGSANASRGAPDTIDWGMRTSAADVVSALRDRFERNWNAAHALAA